MAGINNPVPGTPSEQAHERRRSIRVRIVMPVTVRGTTGAQQFEEQTQTIDVSAHGCTVHLAAQVVRGQEVSVVNPKTTEELSCTVITVGPADGSAKEIGLEFSKPAPRFWRMAFPPEDWDPSERKLPPPSPRRSRPRR